MPDDEIDEKLRKKLAWATSLDESAAEEEEEDPAALEATRARARVFVEGLTKDVERAWALPDAEQVAAAARIAKRIAKHGLEIAAMPNDADAVRLVRLLVRHRESLDEASWGNARALLGFLSLDDDNVESLIVDIVTGNAWDLTTTMLFALGNDFDSGARPRLTTALTAMLDNVDLGYERRALAAHFLYGDPKRKPEETRAALRRALRAPHLELRWKAMNALGDAIDDESVVFLLEDAVMHPLRENHWELPSHYCEGLKRAVRDKHPEGALTPLERMVHGDVEHDGRERDWLDDAWALATLAAGFPERAIPIIDGWSRDGKTYTRIWAARAAADLPREEALLRLSDALADVSLNVSRDAKRLLEQLGEPASPPVLPACFEGLFAAKPSDKMVGRILAAHAVDDLKAFKEKLASTLLAEAPDPEALVVYLMLFDGNHGFDGNALGFLVRFGEVALRAVCRIIEAYPNGLHAGWAHIIKGATQIWEDEETEAAEETAQKRALLAAMTPELRAVIARVMRSPTWDGEGCLPLLHTIGADAGHLDALWPLIVAGGYQTFYASMAIKTIDSPEMTERVLRAARAAWDAHDEESFTSLFALRSEEPRMIALADEILATFAPEDDGIASYCASACHQNEEAWFLEHLAWGDRLVEIAVSVVHFSSCTPAMGARVNELFRTAPDARSKIVAARAMVWAKERITSKDFSATLDHADADAAAKLVDDAILLGTSPASFRRHFERIFRDATEPIVLELVERLESIKRKRSARAILQSALTQTTSASVRAAIAGSLGLPGNVKRYWQ